MARLASTDSSPMDGHIWKEEAERLAAQEDAQAEELRAIAQEQQSTEELVPMVRQLFAELNEDGGGSLDKGKQPSKSAVACVFGVDW